MVFPYYLQDSDAGDLAEVVWEYGIDLNDDGKIVDTDGEEFLPLTHASVARDVGGTLYPDSGDDDLATGSAVGPDGLPWGTLHHLVWDSVYDLGVPTTPRTDLILRATPYDYKPADPDDKRLGIVRQIAGFKLEKDPNGLYLVDWYPSETGPDADPFQGPFTGVKTDEPLVFVFSAPVDQDSLNRKAIQVFKGSGAVLVEGHFVADNSSGRGVVTFYPQAQEIPSRPDVLENTTSYSITVPGYDPNDRGQELVKRDGADPDDTNAYNLLLPVSRANDFSTGIGVLTDVAAPSFLALNTPVAGSSDVTTDTKIEVEIDDRLLPSSVTADNFEVVVVTASGTEVVISGTFGLRNTVEGLAGSVRAYSVITFTPDLTLPPDAATVEVRVKTGLTDLAGNTLAAQATSTFETAASTKIEDKEFTESFDDTDNRDIDHTTAFWGTAEPPSLGNAAGEGKAGLLTGLYDGGDGSDGELDLTSGDETLTSSSDNHEWNFTKLVIPKGKTLTLEGTEAICIRVQGDVEIYGTIDASGEDGTVGLGFSATITTKQDGPEGGEGGPGAGKGGDSEDYTFKQSSKVDGEDGENHEGDKGGDGAGLGGPGGLRTNSGSTYGISGSGGGHATEGEKGRGSTGGGGGGVVVSYAPNNWFGGAAGGTGAGGGGSVKIAANGQICLASTGTIKAEGGDGGDGVRASAWTTVYTGGGGGGSGGTIFLQAGEFKLDGGLSVLGGKGGAGGYTFSSVSLQNPGGDGGDGRIRLEAPGFQGKNFQGVVVTGSATVSCGGTGTTDWTISSDTTVNTDNGFGAPVGTFDDGAFSVRNLDVKPGATLTVTGTKPLVVYASGDVCVEGLILAAGAAGDDASKTVYFDSSNRGWRYDLAEGGKGGPGGFDGGGNAGKSSYSKTFPTSTDGVGTDGEEGGDGAGLAGDKDDKPYERILTSYTYYYYYYSGAGGGGGSAEDGDDGTQLAAYLGTYQGSPGDGGDAVVDDPLDLDDESITGGAGGGGGANGGYTLVWKSGTRNPYFYSYGPASAGGGGGGGIFICSDGEIKLAGTIDASGGDGGLSRPTSTSYSWFAGPGGGGGGGNVVLCAADGFKFGLAFINASGGTGGDMVYSSSTYSRGGAGGDGAIVLKSATKPVLPADLPEMDVGGGSFTGGDFKPTNVGISIWKDTGAFSPVYVSGTVTGNGLAKMFVQGAQTDPATGEADETNTTAWIEVTADVTVLNGYRWCRFKVELVSGEGKLPEAESVSVKWQVVK
jgi:hypothetical protein